MKGHDVTAPMAEADRKRLLLERFQREVRRFATSTAAALPGQWMPNIAAA